LRAKNSARDSETARKISGIAHQADRLIDARDRRIVKDLAARDKLRGARLAGPLALINRVLINLRETKRRVKRTRETNNASGSATRDRASPCPRSRSLSEIHFEMRDSEPGATNSAGLSKI